MELMSSLLLCALAALLPQALGITKNGKSEIIRDSSKVIETPVPRKTIWLSEKIPSAVTLKMILKKMAADKQCSTCMNCINKAMYSYILTSKKNLKTTINYLSNGDLPSNVVDNYHQYKIIRKKRDSKTNTSSNAVTSLVTKSENVAVTRYNINGEVYAIKIREKRSTDTVYQHSQSCQVYRVKKNYPCDSPKADLILAAVKKEANKRTKKHTKNTPTASKPPTKVQPHFATRARVLAEPFMTSIEELYN